MVGCSPTYAFLHLSYRPARIVPSVAAPKVLIVADRSQPVSTAQRLLHPVEEFQTILCKRRGGKQNSKTGRETGMENPSWFAHVSFDTNT
jgi:hypothetical protein